MISFWFFKEVVLTSEWQEISFYYSDNSNDLLDITLVSDSLKDLFFSWNGINIDGKLKRKEIMAISKIGKRKIYVKGLDTMRIYVQRN